jgi:mannitol/fructose-specific phosphotransferase system IIA component (Ntr-type)
MRLSDLLTTADIAFGIRGPDIGNAAATLLRQTLPKRGYAPADVSRLADAVVAREREASTLCGPIAIPHARDPRSQSFVAAIGVNEDGVIEGQPTPRIVFAFISPESNRTEHLALLSSLARLSRDQPAVDAIGAAKDSQSVLDVIRSRNL